MGDHWSEARSSGSDWAVERADSRFPVYIAAFDPALLPNGIPSSECNQLMHGASMRRCRGLQRRRAFRWVDESCWVDHRRREDAHEQGTGGSGGVGVCAGGRRTSTADID